MPRGHGALRRRLPGLGRDAGGARRPPRPRRCRGHRGSRRARGRPRRTTGTSVYVRDPDGNLLEFIRYPDRGPEVTDETAITALVHSYASLLDAGDVDAVAALFEHSTWRSAASDVVRHGSAEVRPVYEQLVASGALPGRSTSSPTDRRGPAGRLVASSRCYLVRPAIRHQRPAQYHPLRPYIDRLPRSTAGASPTGSSRRTRWLPSR